MCIISFQTLKGIYSLGNIMTNVSTTKTMQIFDYTSDVLLACVVLSTRLFTLFSAFNFVPRALFPGEGRAFDGKFALGTRFVSFYRRSCVLIDENLSIVK